MNDLVRWLLDLDRLDPGGENVRFGFEHAIPGWLWVGLIAGAAVVAAWSYRRLIGSRPMRLLLTGVRAALLVLLLVLVAGPRLVKETERVEPDWVLVLVDRSASMTIGDVTEDGESDAKTRDEQLRAALERSLPMWTELSRRKEVRWLGFDAGAFDLATRSGADGALESVSLETPDGQRTTLGRALDQALAGAAARPVSAVVVISDGRSADSVTRGALRRLTAERVPVHAVALGSREPVGDLAIRRADGPRVAFVDDFTPVEVEVERLGGDPDATATVKLVDQLTREVLDERTVRFEAGEDARTISLETRSADPGRRTLVVELDAGGRDLIEGNNSAEVRTEFIDRPMRVLYIDGYPRWEQRYLKNMLLREGSIESTSLLLAPDREYIQEGDVELDALPDSPERWSEYDVIILGDVRPDVFTFDQLDQIREHIALNGAGLIWIGGPSSTPASWWGVSLGDLVPFTSSAHDGTSVGEPVLMRPTDVAGRLGVLRLGDAEDPWPRALTDVSTGWSQIRWAQWIRPDGLKPITEVVAWGDPVYRGPEEATPLVMSMRYGAGRALYVATDEIWRWRYGRGELLPERFWVQMIRLLGRESLSRTGRSALLTLSPRRSIVDQPVRVELELLDQSLIDRRMGSVIVEARKRPAPGDDGPELVEEITLGPDGGDRRVFATVWLPPEPGQWDLEPRDRLALNIDTEADAVVSIPDDELRSPETDHDALASLADATEGAVLAPDELDRLPDLLRNRSIIIRNEIPESLWDTPLALILALTLLTFEWVGRRLIKLL